MPHSFAEVSYTLSNLLVCKYLITSDTFSGTPTALADGQMLKVEPEADTDRQRGYGAITRALTVAIGAKLTLDEGGITSAAYIIMTGSKTNTSATTPNQVRTIDDEAGGAGLPYFGIIGTSPTDDGGLIVVGMKACKLDKHPDYTADGTQNKFNISSTSGYAVPIANKLMRRKFYETASGFTAPIDAATMLAFFTAPSL